MCPRGPVTQRCKAFKGSKDQVVCLHHQVSQPCPRKDGSLGNMPQPLNEYDSEPPMIWFLVQYVDLYALLVPGKTGEHSIDLAWGSRDVWLPSPFAKSGSKRGHLQGPSLDGRPGRHQTGLLRCSNYIRKWVSGWWSIPAMFMIHETKNATGPARWWLQFVSNFQPYLGKWYEMVLFESIFDSYFFQSGLDQPPSI